MEIKLTYSERAENSASNEPLLSVLAQKFSQSTRLTLDRALFGSCENEILHVLC